jgi:hypothetical protein
MKLLLLAVLLVLTEFGCATSPHSDRAVKSAAEDYAVKNFGFKRPIVTSIRRTSMGYKVIVWERPYAPGGFYFEYLSIDLQLVDWQAGR